MPSDLVCGDSVTAAASQGGGGESTVRACCSGASRHRAPCPTTSNFAATISLVSEVVNEAPARLLDEPDPRSSRTTPVAHDDVWFGGVVMARGQISGRRRGIRLRFEGVALDEADRRLGQGRVVTRDTPRNAGSPLALSKPNELRIERWHAARHCGARVLRSQWFGSESIAAIRRRPQHTPAQMSASPSPYDRIRQRLPRPVGEQASVVALAPRGHHVVLGTAGSGKTTMAMLRSLFLSDTRAEHGGRTLLVTFNKALLAFLRNVVPDQGDSLHVRNYHWFARGYLASRRDLPYGSILDDSPRRRLIEHAVIAVRGRSNDSVLQREMAFFVAELNWIVHHGIRDEAGYRAADRVGRQQALAPTSRPAVWAVLEEYGRLRAVDGHLYDWQDLAGAVREEFARDSTPRYYRHVVIDEGQDFSPQMLRSLVDAVGTTGSVTFFGDVAQQIYGRDVPGVAPA